MVTCTRCNKSFQKLHGLSLHRNKCGATLSGPNLEQNLSDSRSRQKKKFAHLKRELVQKVWELLLDEEFMDAYEHGLVITCADGVTRLFYPRFFTYSADYLEKLVFFSFCLNISNLYF